MSKRTLIPGKRALLGITGHAVATLGIASHCPSNRLQSQSVERLSDTLCVILAQEPGRWLWAWRFRGAAGMGEGWIAQDPHRDIAQDCTGSREHRSRCGHRERVRLSLSLYA